MYLSQASWAVEALFYNQIIRINVLNRTSLPSDHFKNNSLLHNNGNNTDS